MCDILSYTPVNDHRVQCLYYNHDIKYATHLLFDRADDINEREKEGESIDTLTA